MKHLIVSIAALALIGAAASAKPMHGHFKGQELAGQATVTMAQARATALKAHPGQVTDQELEKEAGGSGLRYSFDIKSGGHTFEVGVDAKTGEVLENKAEGKNPD